MKVFKKVAAFTLLELSIVMVVTAFLLTGILSVTTNKAVQDAATTNAAILQKLDKAITKYYATNGFLPCPAPLNAGISSGSYANFGVSTNCSLAAPAGTTDTVAAAANIVRTGAVPVRTLGLADTDMFDYWGNRITYAMIRNLGIDAATYTATLPTTNAIIVQDINGNSQVGGYVAPNHIAYVLVSHGPNNTGAYNYAGTQAVTCAGGGADVENCNADATFKDSYFLAGSFDDTLIWGTRQILKFNNDTINKIPYTGASSISPTYVAQLNFQTFGGGVGVFATGWNNARIFNQLMYNDIPGFTWTCCGATATLPPGTYYLRATTTGCRVNNFLNRIRNTTASTIIGVGNAAYAAVSTLDCGISEAVTIQTFAANTDIVVDEYIQFSMGTGRDYSSGATPTILDNTPTYQEPYTTLTLEIQKWN